MNFYTNIDANTITWPFLRKICENETVTPDMLFPFVDCYAGTQITDVLFNIFAQLSEVDSDVFTDYADKYEQTTENGIAVDNKNQYDALYFINKKHGIDPYKVWIDRVRENGQKAWISVRMNDAHCPFDEVSFLRPDFFYEAREKGWMIGDGYGPSNYFKICLNYAVKEVRDKFLAYIDEQLTRYDCDGLELDFMREIICFPYDKTDGTEIMTGFMRDVKALVTKYEEKYAHKIRIGVRLCRDIEKALKFGFDARAFDREGLCDLIVVTPRWFTNDSHMKIAEWKKECPHVEISAGLELGTGIVQADGAQRTTSPATARGFALHNFAEGADSAYLFNYFFCPGVFDEEYRALCREVSETCGDPASCAKKPHRYLMTLEDFESCPNSMKRFCPLPMKIGFEQVRFRMNAGAIGEGRKAALLIGFKAGSVQDIELFVNGVKIFAFEKTDRGIIDTDKPDAYIRPGTTLYRSDIPEGIGGNMMLAIRNVGDNEVFLNYVCIDVK